MKKYLLGVCTLLGVLLLTSCGKDDFSSYMPTYRGFSFSKNGVTLQSSQLVKEDSITITAVQSTLGRLLNSTSYTWTISSEGSELMKMTRMVIYDDNKENPSFKFKIPNTGAEVTISFTARFRYSGQGTIVNSLPYDDSSESLSGQITRKNSSTIEGTMSGSVTFRPIDP